MIHVRYSNRIEQLVAALADALPPPGNLDAMFDGPWLVIPGRPLELYVDLELARRRGSSGSFDTLSVRGAFGRLCARALPDVTLIERGHITGELLALLSDESLKDNPACAEINGYLQGAGPGLDAINRRRVDVARALGELFDEWTLTRPEMLAAWRSGDDGAPPKGDAPRAGPAASLLARGEHALWVGLFGPTGRFARRGAVDGRRYLTLDAVLSENLDEAWCPPSAVHFFGLSRLPRGLQLALARLGTRTEVQIYAVNPCREFWEDVDTRAARPTREKTRAKPRDSRQLEFTGLVDDGGRAGMMSKAAPAPAGGEGDNPFLRAWGHAGRESTRLFNQLADGDFEAAFISPGVATLLSRVQGDVLERHPARGPEGALNLEADGSLVVLGAPNPRRELETIAAEIWSLVRADAARPGASTTPLRFSDIAVLIAGSDEPYLSLASAVFREAQDLPHSIVDQPIAGGSHLVEAVLALLALPLGAFTRREVLDVITHPNVRARFPDADPQTWLRLCEGLAIAHGADRAALADTYIEDDLFNWDQGLKRLALGLFARGPHSGVDDEVGGYLPAEVAPDARADADTLGLLVRSLLADARFARSARLSVPDWTGFVRALIGAYIVPVTPDDEQARRRVFTALDQMAAEAPPALIVTLGTALDLITAAVAGLRGTHGQILGGGVTVGMMASLRAVPFRVIFVAGLAAERFPTAERISPFEVGLASLSPNNRPRAGEVTPRQQDRYLFLETMLAARDRMILSYVDRDALTGELRESSPLVLELLDQLHRGYLEPDGAATSSLRRRVPLHRDEDSRLHEAFPAAAAEARARLLGISLQQDVPSAAGLPTSHIIRALSPGARHDLASVLRTIDLGDDAQARASGSVASARRPMKRPEPAKARVVRLIDLRRFLECPLQGSARIFLGLRDLPDDTDARETADEPFEIPRSVERNLLGEVLCGAWRNGEIPEVARLPALYDAEIARHRYRRLFPAGLFRANVRRRHLRTLSQWLESLSAAAGAVRGPLRRVCFGRPEPFASPSERRPAIRLNVDLPGQGSTPVEVHGITEPQIAGADGAGSLVLTTSSDKENNDRDSLRAFLDHVALAASLGEGQAPSPFAGMVCRPSRDGSVASPHSLSWEALPGAAARTYLTALIGELLSGVHAYLFPCEAVFRSFDDQMSLVDRIDQVRADKFYRDHSSSRFGPVPEPFDYPTPPADLAQKYVTARFGLLQAAHAPPRARGKKGAS